MTTLIKVSRNTAAAFAVLMFAALPFTSVQAASTSGYTFYPDTSYTFYPDTEYTFYPDTSYTFYPDTNYTYYPDTEYTYYPDTSYDYYPDTSYTYYPDTSYTYYPDTQYTYYEDEPIYDHDSYYNENSLYASIYASSYSSSYSYNYDNDGGCKKNCGDKPKPKPVCALSISPSHVDYGDDAEIHWTSENATSATLTDFGSVSTGGSKEIENIKHDKTYTLTVKGPGGTATCSDRVEVEEKEDDLECELDVSDDNVRRGDYVRVSWESQAADYGRISPDIGRVDEEGSERVRVYEDTTFKGTFYNDDDEVTCRVDVDVDRDVYIPPQVPYVTLSAVPYTGFELGPVGTAIHWSLLVLWCLIAAYLIAVKKAHYALARRINKFLFGTGDTHAPAAPTVVMHTPVVAHPAPSAHAHATNYDSTDEFVLSQLNRGRHAH